MRCTTKHAGQVRALVARGLSDRQIAETLGTDPRSVCQVRRRLGLKCNTVRPPFNPDEQRIIRRDYRIVPAPQIATTLGRSIGSTYREAKRLGLSIDRPRITKRPGLVAAFKSLHAKGWSDEEISQVLGCERHAIEHLRHQLGLGHNAYSEHRRRRVAARTAEQLRKAGLSSIGQLRPAAHRKYARDHGWPDDLKPRQVQILELLWQNGPMTKDELGAAMGLTVKTDRWHGPHYAMMCNKPKQGGATTSYTANLIHRGLLISLGRIVPRKPAGARTGQGHNVVLYSLPLNIERTPA